MPNALGIGLLGPLQVRDETGRPVHVGGRQLRVLLTLLALNAGRVVPVASIAFAVASYRMCSWWPMPLSERAQESVSTPEPLCASDQRRASALPGPVPILWRAYPRQAARTQ
jgi:hypothetical protein